ncbi:MAG: ATP-binding protein [Promethearchaeota archaeon]
MKKFDKELNQKQQKRNKILKERKEKYKKNGKIYQCLYENTPLGYQSLDEKGDLLHVNKIWLDFFGYSKTEVLGMWFGEFLVPEIRDEFKSKFSSLKEGGEIRGVEWEVIRKDGSHAILSFDGKIIYDEEGNLQQTNFIFRERKELKKSNRILKNSEQKNSEIYNCENFYYDLFIHNINNIFTNIQSSIELSTIYLNKSKNLDKINELYEIIKEQIARGAKLISNFRKLSQLKKSEISIKNVDVCIILRKAIKFIKDIYQARKIVKVQVESNYKRILVQANKLLIDAFENILINAVNYNNNSIVEIIVKLSKVFIEKVKYIKIEFLDNGFGIEDARKKLIFQERYRDKEKSKGMGFGLNLVKKIIKVYNGKIWVEDRIMGDYTKGSNFILLIREA